MSSSNMSYEPVWILHLDEYAHEENILQRNS